MLPRAPLPRSGSLNACALAALLLSLAPYARAQAAGAPAPTPTGKPDQAGASKGTEPTSEATPDAGAAKNDAEHEAAAEGSSPDDGNAEGDEEAAEQKAVTAETPAATVAPVKEATPPFDPNAQMPTPVPLDDAPDAPSRAIEVGAMVGVANRPSEDDQITYGPAVAWAIYARPEIRSWLGVRLYYREESIPVTVEDGGFGDFGKTSFDQENLHLRSLGMRVEPSWEVAPRLKLMAIGGLAWLRFVAPAPTSTGEIPDIQTAKRSGVELDFIGGLGASFELIPDWMTVGASIAYGVSTDRTGNAHENVQAFSDGKRYTLGPLPHFDGVTDLLFSFGLIL